MNRRLNVILCLGGLMVILIFVRKVTFADTKSTITSAATETRELFVDKIVLFELARTSGFENAEYSVTLTDAEVIPIGDQHFVRGVGYGPKDQKSSNWHHGVKAAFRWSDVTGFYVFENDDELNVYYSALQPEENSL